MNRQEVYKLIDGERDYQDKRWNCDTTTSCGKHTVEEWIMYMEDYLAEAKHILCRNPRQEADNKAMDIIRKVTGMGVAAMEQNETPARIQPLEKLECDIAPVKSAPKLIITTTKKGKKIKSAKLIES